MTKQGLARSEDDVSVLSGRQIRELVESGKLVIDPFDRELVEPASYDLRLGSRILAAPLGEAMLGEVVDLSDDSPSYRIQPGQMVGVLSEEKLILPLELIGRFGIRSTFARKGVNAFGGLQLDPGFSGRLILSLLNVGPEETVITRGEPFFSVEFERLEEPAESPYSGPYQDQDDFPADQYNHIMSARTTSLAEIPMLRKQVARLNILIEELEERLPDTDEGLEVREEITERLRRSINRPLGDFLSLEDVRRKLRLSG